MRNRNLNFALYSFTLVLLLSLAFAAGWLRAKARGLQVQTTPQWISYQGFLTDDSGLPVEGVKDISFRIFATASEPASLWQEAHAGVTINGGDFAVHLGEFAPLPEDLFDLPERWLEIEVDGVTLSPRQRFNSVPYALNADKLDGHDSEELMAGTLPQGAIIWFPQGSSPTGFSLHETALGEDVGPWQPIALTPASMVGGYSAFRCDIWTGTEVLCWGFLDDQAYGMKYNPSNNQWTTISQVNAPAGVTGFSMIWTGTEMIVWGGRTRAGALTNTGGRYNPLNDSWMQISTTNAPSARNNHSAIWTGAELIIWGGFDYTVLGDGYRYSPSGNTWVPISQTGAPTAREGNIALWTGSKMIIWSGNGYTGASYLMDGALYNPVANSWQPMSTEGGRSQYIDSNAYPSSSIAVWTGTEMVFSYGKHLIFYNPSSNTWRDRLCFQFSLQAESPHLERILLAGNYLVTTGSIYDLSQDKAIATFPAIHWSYGFWTGEEVLLLDAAGFSGSITGMRHTIDLVFPYQKE